jgi:transcriptional regulator with XRE-family HTH domain
MLSPMDSIELLTQIGRRIRFLRKERGYSQERLSELAGIHPTSLSELERGRVNGFIGNYFSLAKALDVTLADLVDTDADLGDAQSWREVRDLLGMIRSLDEKRRAVYLDAAVKLFERLESI